MKKYKLCDLSSIKDKNVILMFSGGYDSTSILLNLLQEGSRNIKCVYVDIPNNTDKSKIEQKRCKRILKKVNKLFGVDLKLTIYKSMTIVDNNTVTFGQPFLFITTIAPMIQKDDDYVLFGFHYNSSIWHCHERFEEAFKNINYILRCSRKNNNEYNAMLYSPFEFYRKYQIIQYIKQFKGVYRLCWTCEGVHRKSPKKPCGECVPCRNLKKALNDIKFQEKMDKKCKKKK